MATDLASRPTHHSCDSGSVESLRSSRTSRTGRQFIQLFSCQRCRKKRRRKKTTFPPTTSTSKTDNGEGSFLSVKQQKVDVDSAHRTGSPRRSQPARKIDDIKRQLFQSTSPDRSRSNLTRARVRNSDYELGSLPSGVTKASILKNRSSPSPIKFVNQSQGEIFFNDTERITSSSILARSAKLKNESGYGSFSFQRQELGLLFELTTPPPESAGSDLEIEGGSGLSLNIRKSMASDSDGSASSLCIPAKRNCEATSSGRRARFNEAVDVIFDDRRSGRPMVKDCIKLKQSPEDRDLSPLEIKMLNSERVNARRAELTSVDADEFFRSRAGSDCGLNSTFLMSAKDSYRRTQKRALGEAKIEIERLAVDSSSDAGRGRASLRVVIELAEDISRERVFVRTARGGTRLLVGAYRPEPLGDGTNYLRQFVDRYRLPHAIDILSVKANLGEDLVITAELFDFEN